MTQSTSICGPGNAPGIDGGLNICVNEEIEKDVFVDFVGPLPSWAGLSTLVRFCIGGGFTLLEAS